ncbi:MAG: hypothetical protein AVDCRST_MAG65-497 [uncultured Solirubrobacteraceae bacterium]|uniref:Isoprenylcysteine carboxylmethyltransferase family protein n=1 Tax=uncultured Solirubrobacteraceae bacterium TaxID=1162706 RepID=A0A6J4RJU2_9ACTN|nr:MAG: hypothetical protein AVDCRST_MAG65-497 [uncultured Solirubrobacteraceae bacterium]
MAESKQARSESNEHAGVPVPPPLIYAAGYLVGLGLQRALPLSQPPAGAARPLGALLVAAGVALPAAGITLFGRRGTSVLPVRPTTALVTSGPYRLTRNPMYVGFGLIHAGVALRRRETWPLLLLAPVLLAVDRIVIRREEPYLEGVFGDEYRRYRRRVRRWL